MAVRIDAAAKKIKDLQARETYNKAQASHEAAQNVVMAALAGMTIGAKAST